MSDTPEPGLYADVPMLTYHGWEGASQSRLKVIRDKSPAHLRWQMDHPEEPTGPQRIGAAVHTAVLEPHLFAETYARGPEGNKTLKAVKAAWAALEAEDPSKVILKPAEWDLCMALRRKIEGHRIAARLLDGQPERSAIWEDEDTGAMCRGRFDLISDRAPVIVDLKTTRDASRKSFGRDLFQFGYYLQAAHYLAGAKALDIDAQQFVIVAIEKEPPHEVAIYDVDAGLIELARDELKPLLAVYAACERSGIWPGYAPKVQTIDIPMWAWREVEDRLGVEP